MLKAATISECGKYRYRLSRSGLGGTGRVCWIMLNPSTADAEVDDPTIRRCIGFTKRLGHDEMVVVNLFAFRATDPCRLLEADDPVGPENARYVREAIDSSTVVIAGWGVVPKKIRGRSLFFRNWKEIWCLGKTADGSPRHPLYLRSDAPLVAYP